MTPEQNYQQVQQLKRERAMGRHDGGADTGVMRNFIIRGSTKPCVRCNGTGRVSALPSTADLAAQIKTAMEDGA